MKKTLCVVVAHPETNAVVTPTSNPLYGTIRVDQSITSMENGWMRNQKRTAFLRGLVTDLASFKAGQTLTGQIVRKESHVPFYEGQTPKINPTTGEIVLLNGLPVYKDDSYTDDLSASSYQFISEHAEIVVNDEQAV